MCIQDLYGGRKKTNYSDKKKYIYLLKRNANEPVTRFGYYTLINFLNAKQFHVFARPTYNFPFFYIRIHFIRYIGAEIYQILRIFFSNINPRPKFY